MSLSLEIRMRRLGVSEEDLDEKFILGAGSGGQKINKTSSCVWIKHIPTGIEVKCQESRSREKNRELARLALCDRLEKMAHQKLLERKKQIAKVRRQNQKPSRAQKEKVAEGKRKRAHTKQLRQKPKID